MRGSGTIARALVTLGVASLLAGCGDGGARVDPPVSSPTRTSSGSSPHPSDEIAFTHPSFGLTVPAQWRRLSAHTVEQAARTVPAARSLVADLHAGVLRAVLATTTPAGTLSIGQVRVLEGDATLGAAMDDVLAHARQLGPILTPRSTATTVAGHPARLVLYGRSAGATPSVTLVYVVLEAGDAVTVSAVLPNSEVRQQGSRVRALADGLDLG